MMNSSSKVVKIRNEAAEAVYSATYIEDYIDAIENLPDEIQRLLSRLKELDVETQNYVRDLKNYMDSAQGKEKDPGIIQRIQCLLIQVQDIGDEKIQIGQQVQDFVENRYRQLELDKKTLDAATRQPEREVPEPVVTPSAPVEPSDPYCRTYEPQHSRMKRARRARMDPSISGSKDEFPEVFQPSSSVSQTKPSSSTTTVSQKRKEKDKDKDKDNHDKDHDTPIVTPTTSTRRRNVSESADHVAATNVHETSSTRTPKKRKEIDSQDDKPAATSAPATVTKRQYTYKSDKRKSENKDKDKEKEKEPTEKKKRKSRQVDDSPPLNLPIDPDEPTYCLCDQVSYGDMIGCDNDLCPIEWFHFNCVSLTLKPKGKWYCPKCRGDRPNVMKNKAIFLKELEEYNREKEEKA